MRPDLPGPVYVTAGMRDVLSRLVSFRWRSI
jgi:hypothetical protein